MKALGGVRLASNVGLRENKHTILCVEARAGIARIHLDSVLALSAGAPNKAVHLCAQGWLSRRFR